jgi:hypothetical protein
MMSKDDPLTMTRRTALGHGVGLVAAIGVSVVFTRAAQAKAKAAKDDFFYSEEPGEGGKQCSGCINFSAKPTGAYGAKSGDCSLVQGDVCTTCYCEGWTDKLSPGAKKAG